MVDSKEPESGIENRYAMSSDEAIRMIKLFFADELPLFVLSHEYNLPNGYWGIEFNCDRSKVLIKSGRGYLEVEVIKNDSPISLTDVDKTIEQVRASSKQNISLVLNAIKMLFTLL